MAEIASHRSGFGGEAGRKAPDGAKGGGTALLSSPSAVTVLGRSTLKRPLGVAEAGPAAQRSCSPHLLSLVRGSSPSQQSEPPVLGVRQ